MKISLGKKKILHGTGNNEATLQNAERDWLIILITGFLCMIGIIVYHVYFYNLVETGAFYGSEKKEEQKNMRLDIARLTHAVAQMNERENWPQVIASTTSRFVDPSE